VNVVDADGGENLLVGTVAQAGLATDARSFMRGQALLSKPIRMTHCLVRRVLPQRHRHGGGRDASRATLAQKSRWTELEGAQGAPSEGERGSPISREKYQE